jgi:hypothetical protein
MSVSSSNITGSDLNTTDTAGIRGGTDATVIGNTGDRLKVDGSGVTQPVAEVEYATFVVFGNDIATANNKSMLSIVNSGVAKVKIREIRFVNAQNAAVTGVIAEFYLYRCGSHSAGTTLVPVSHDTADILGAITVRTGATIGTEVTGILRHWEWSTDEWSSGTHDVESSDHGLQTLLGAYYPIQKTKPITLNKDEGITIKCTTNTATGLFDILILFTQE